MEEQVISLEEIFEALKKRWKMIVAVTLGATLLSAIISFFIIKPQYEASTKVFIGKEESESQSYNNNDIQMYQKLMKTYSETIKTKDLVDRALKTAKIDKQPEEVLGVTTVVPVADTQILQIKVQDTSADDAAKIVTAITNEFIKTSKELVPNGNVQILEKVEVPENPVSPNKKMNIAIAFLLGAMVSVGIAFLLEFLDNTYKTKEQLERDIEIPVLGGIPMVEDN